MTIRNLNAALAPGSVALVGASATEGSVGTVVLNNIISGGYEGDIWPVNPRRKKIQGLTCYPTPADLPGAPDLAVVVTPPKTVPKMIRELGEKGCRTVVVITAGINDKSGLRQKMLEAARPFLLRVIGPNSVGLILPRVKLNASFCHIGAAPGNLALLSQSGAIVTTLVDWAAERDIGFSQIVSLGDQADVDIADYLDLLSMDGNTRAVLVYIESVPHARKFMTAARAVARLKPVVAIKAGRSPQAAKAAATHTGALSGADAVVDAALHRAGVLRVRGMSEMFAAAETVSRFRPLRRARLGIVTNGGGAGVLAVDRLMEGAGELAEPTPKTIRELDKVLPKTWSRANPVDIIGDAPPERYASAVTAMAKDKNTDVVLVMNCPTALASPSDAAKEVAGLVRKGTINRKPVLSCWLGGKTARAARRILRDAGVASYENPASAAGAARHLTEWSQAQHELLRVPDRQVENAMRRTPRDARQKAKTIFESVAADRRSMLTEPEAKAVLAAYAIDVPKIRMAQTPEEAAVVAQKMLAKHRSLAIKLVSRDITHKSDVGGVVLGVDSARRAEDAALGITARALRAHPNGRIDGFAIQPMVSLPGSLEVILGVSTDPIFGPVIMFGAGGTAVEVLHDTAVALPPLDASLAADLIRRTRISQLLEGYRDHPAADAPALQGALIGLSHLVEDFPCLRSVDINPLLAGPDGAVALDARIEIDPEDLARSGPNPDLAIRPYPAEWRKEVKLKDGTYVIRPVRPADALLYPEFLAELDPNDIRLRFMAPRRHFPEEMALKMTQLDYDREMAFVALAPDGRLAGVSRLSSDPDKTSAEYALLVRSDLHGRGLGSLLMNTLIDYSRADGLKELEGMVLTENRGMLGLVGRLGFKETFMPDEPGVTMTRLKL